MHALFELWNTSAPRGLKPGSIGFCTVKCSRGMPVNLVDRLEMLSGYRHLFPPTGELAHQNPVVYSHQRMTLGGVRYHVLSRVANAGLDYSGRSNRFAHHVVLSPEALPPAGPAWLLQQPGVMETAWDGQVEVITTRRSLPTADVPPAPCRYWKSLTGDAAHAATLLEAFLTTPPKTVCLLAPLEVDVLKLFGECIALLPPSLRWEVTFTTFFVGLPPEVECLWRGVLLGTPEAEAVRRRHGVLLLDVTKQLPLPRDEDLAEAARRGHFAVEAKPKPLPQVSALSEPYPTGQPISGFPAPREAEILSPIGLEISPTPPAPRSVTPQLPPDPHQPVTLPPTLDSYGFGDKRFPRTLLVGLSLAIILVSLLGIGSLLIASRRVAREDAARPTPIGSLPPQAKLPEVPKPSEVRKPSDEKSQSKNLVPPASENKSERETEAARDKKVEDAPESQQQSEPASEPSDKDHPNKQPSHGEPSSNKGIKTDADPAPGTSPPPSPTSETPQTPTEDQREKVSRTDKIIFAEIWDLSQPSDSSSKSELATSKELEVGDTDAGTGPVTLELIALGYSFPQPHSQLSRSPRRNPPTAEPLKLVKRENQEIWDITAARATKIGTIEVRKQAEGKLQLALELRPPKEAEKLRPYLLEVGGVEKPKVLQLFAPIKIKSSCTLRVLSPKDQTADRIEISLTPFPIPSELSDVPPLSFEARFIKSTSPQDPCPADVRIGDHGTDEGKVEGQSTSEPSSPSAEAIEYPLIEGRIFFVYEKKDSQKRYGVTLFEIVRE